MRSFAEIYQWLPTRKDGEAALEALLPRPEDAAALAAKPDDRWLSAMTCCVFQEAFNAWHTESGRPIGHISRTLAAMI